MADPIVVTAPTLPPPRDMQAAGALSAPASPHAVRRFEQLMYAPPGAAETSRHGIAQATGESSMRLYLHHLSQRWEAGQATVEKMLAGGKFTTSELMLTQIRMLNCALDVEVSTKVASTFENGVQTLIQRGGA